MMEVIQMIVKNRQEYLFLYDAMNCNPNGDPLDENKPRVDEETGINIVTPMRLKRTVRDYSFIHGYEVLVREVPGQTDDTVGDMKTRMIDFLKLNGDETEEEKKAVEALLKDGKVKTEQVPFIKNNVVRNLLRSAIDVRMFGTVASFDIKVDGKKPVTKTITYTGPVQFGMGISLHRVKIMPVQHSFVLSSNDTNSAGSMGTEYILPYSLIAFWGVVNENTAKDTNLTDEDVAFLDKALWNGTKDLITSSKIGETPRLLIRIEYLNGMHTGNLQHKVRIVSDKEDEELRNTKDYVLDMSELFNALSMNSSNIVKIHYKHDPSLVLSVNGKQGTFEELFNTFNLEEMEI
jgi:CRISPR-associated protein Csh2